MTFSELVKDRYSVRSYSDRPVEDDKIAAVLEAGRVAPTAKNIQPACVYVVRSPEAIGKLRAVQDGVRRPCRPCHLRGPRPVVR